MTTEQMDEKDDERAGRSRWPFPYLNPDEPAPDLDPEQRFGHEFRPAPEGWFTFGTHAGSDVRLEFSSELDETGDPLWERPIWPFTPNPDDSVKPEKRAADDWEIKSVSAEDYVTMAEEPIENRLRRAWLNGFKEGVQRSAESYEEWGRWDA